MIAWSTEKCRTSEGRGVNLYNSRSNFSNQPIRSISLQSRRLTKTLRLLGFFLPSFPSNYFTVDGAGKGGWGERTVLLPVKTPAEIHATCPSTATT